MALRRPLPSLDLDIRRREFAMKTYVILRRRGWENGDELKEAVTRSLAEGESMADEVSWIRSYVLDETDGSVGTVCIYQAASPEAVRLHAQRAGLPVDEIVAVSDTAILRPDPEPVAA
jgi:hypothetical protein